MVGTGLRVYTKGTRRLADGRTPHPPAAILDSRTLQSTLTSGGPGYDGAKCRKGSKVHLAVDTLGHSLALHVTPANEQDRDQVGQLAQAIQEVSDQAVTFAYVDQGYTGQKAADAALKQGITIEVVKLPEAKRGFVLLPRRWGASAALARLPAFGVWPGITNAFPKPWPVCTIWSLLVSCCPTIADAMNIVQNML